MNSLLAAEGRKLNSGAGGLGGGISSSVFSSCLRSASLAAACRLAGESLMLELGDAEEPLRLVGEALTRTQQKPLSATTHKDDRVYVRAIHFSLLPVGSFLQTSGAAVCLRIVSSPEGC